MTNSHARSVEILIFIMKSPLPIKYGCQQRDVDRRTVGHRSRVTCVVSVLLLRTATRTYKIRVITKPPQQVPIIRNANVFNVNVQFWYVPVFNQKLVADVFHAFSFCGDAGRVYIDVMVHAGLKPPTGPLGGEFTFACKNQQQNT